MSFTTLVETATLAERTGDPRWVVVDCRFRLDDGQLGEREYLAGHIPGAVYADLDRDLSGEKTGTNGRHPLPDPATLAATFGRLGIGAGIQVVAYDQDSGAYASRLWWLLRWLGHEAAAVLNGGYARWLSEGRPTVPGRESREACTFIGTPREEMVVHADEVLELALARQGRLVDARAPERFRGEVEPIDRVAGRIPGATNHFYGHNLTERGDFRSPEALRVLWTGTLAGGSSEGVVCYCGSGVTACHNILALEHAGLGGARLYAGSWSEWASEPTRPTERG
jgi:thiosulfate/3-mercaptopyruvate sulfurtransferase